MQCIRCNLAMDQMYSSQGVLTDFCPQCKSIWLDNGEINYFVKKPAEFARRFTGELLNPKDHELRCPRCAGRLRVGGLLTEELEVEQCTRCQGLWFDAKEIDRLNHALKDISTRPVAKEEETGWVFSMKPAAAAPSGAGTVVAALAPLPNLALRSTATLSLLYILLTVMLLALAEIFDWPWQAAVLIALGLLALQFVISPWLMDLTLRWLQSMHWASWDDLPASVKASVGRICWKHKIPPPRLGIIEDGNPNAFTYGHIPRNARVVVTRGLLEVLDEDELETVVAHELGHAVHYDILVMTAAALVPLVFYLIYRTFMRAESSDDEGGGTLLVAIAVAALILYYVSEYIVLFLSRLREYHADRFAGDTTRKPNSLAVGLTKIAYGLAGKKTEKEAQEKVATVSRRGMARALGIFDPLGARALVATSMGRGTLSTENMLAAMQWDLWNPWARYYELHSSHPLPAKRIQALGAQSLQQGMPPVVNFNLQQPESYWDEFAVDVAVLVLPLIGTLVGLALAFSLQATIWWALALGALGWLLKILFSYRSGEFANFTVSGLLKKVKVSNVRPVPCRLHGTIIGRGIPGLLWSEDLVLQDETGYVFLDYRQPLALFEFLFGLFRAKGVIGQEVVVEGWYRRAPVPYVEMKTLRVRGAPSEHRCYVYPIKLIAAVGLLILGLAAALI